MYPGENLDLYLKGLDELNNAVYTIADVNVANITHNRTDDLYLSNYLHVLADCTNNTMPMQYYARGRDAYTSMINKTHVISVAGVYSVMSVEYKFKLKSIACPPGYLFEDNACTCDHNNPSLLRWVDFPAGFGHSNLSSSFPNRVPRLLLSLRRTLLVIRILY